MEVLIVGISYKSNDVAAKMVASLEAYASSVQIVLVENSTDDREFSKLCGLVEQHSTWVSCYQAKVNEGYFGGFLAGLEFYTGSRGKLPEWVAISNVDLLHKRGDIGAVLGALSPRSEIGAVAPIICSTMTGRDLNPLHDRRPPRSSVVRIAWLVSTYPTYLLALLMSFTKRKLFRPAQRLANNSFIYAPHGSLVFMRNSLFASEIDLQHPPFLFCEEISIAETCRAHGLNILWTDKIEFLHDEHVSTGWFKSRRIWRFHKQAFKYVLERFY